MAKQERPELRNYNPFGGRMRYGHKRGFGGLSKWDVFLWILNALFLIAPLFLIDYFEPATIVIIILSLFTAEAIALWCLRRKPAFNNPKEDQP